MLTRELCIVQLPGWGGELVPAVLISNRDSWGKFTVRESAIVSKWLRRKFSHHRMILADKKPNTEQHQKLKCDFAKFYHIP